MTHYEHIPKSDLMGKHDEVLECALSENPVKLHRFCSLLQLSEGQAQNLLGHFPLKRAISCIGMSKLFCLFVVLFPFLSYIL